MAHSTEQGSERLLPQAPVHYLLKPLTHFLHVEASSGIVLLLCSLIALIMANSPWAEAYLGFWKMHAGFIVGNYELHHSLKHWINDGLMVIFFFVIGLEVKRELVWGELRYISRAILPIAAALGGMILPALIYIGIEWGEVAQRGWGIPMATDIAFVVGCMALLGRRIPSSLRVMLLSLAIVDDIGAILVIALGYTETVHYNWLGLGAGGIVLVLIMQRLGVRSMAMYTLLGLLIWVGFHESGVHATIAGVILGLMTPAKAYLEHSLGGKMIDHASQLFHGDDWNQEPSRAALVTKHQTIVRETVSPLAYLIYLLHPWVAFIIMPLFALANAGVTIHATDLVSKVAIAVIFGLMIGKPLGIFLFCYLATKLRIATLPTGVTWRHMIGGGFLAGIGFTMALFITELALEEEMMPAAKVGVLLGSMLSAIIGMTILAKTPPKEEPVASSIQS